MAVRIPASLPSPAARTSLSMSRWKASSGRPVVRASTPSRSSYGGEDGGSPCRDSRVSFHVRMPVPDVCSQYPGSSLVWPAARPLVKARAAPSWSDASAVSVGVGVSARGEDLGGKAA